MNAINKAIEIAGSASALAREIGVSTQAICFYRDGKRRLPVEKCSAIERATKGAVTRQELRPDDWAQIWPELVTSPPPNAEVVHG
ncbi:transcriptional regulator [Pusillimonas minor]|uniref:Helix-turn-helix domain-containing protein n=1 Tax=Pusillimonas minor TaxID=2697024 RepID=A0A842HIV2_9BURK|nr:helix-turn-helix domain-containing protein [Pusillimonas minor]MBC2768579.1 helix-turn-helix domain-containing protein [Pusillimonas minor]